mmetsp:Transcript_17514/g.37191  ORF Transcript_17514/g.37191 Transcript_17514/m.37191 type:complete len:210 (-) Transcript_17514:756-1385(-)
MIPDAVTRSRIWSMGYVASSWKTFTYLRSIADARTVSSLLCCRQCSTSCAGGKRATAPNLWTYLRASSCLPSRTSICTTSAGACCPSTLAVLALTNFSTPSYRFSSTMRSSSSCVGYCSIKPNSRAKRRAGPYCLLRTSRCSSCVGSKACCRCHRCTRLHASRRLLDASSCRTSEMRACESGGVASSAWTNLRLRSEAVEGITTIFGTA